MKYQCVSGLNRILNIQGKYRFNFVKIIRAIYWFWIRLIHIDKSEGTFGFHNGKQFQKV